MRDDDNRPDPTTPPVNNGIVTTGGTHYVINQAVGHRAQTFSGTVNLGAQEPGQHAQTAELLILIERLLEEHRTVLTDPDAAAKEMRRLREELDEDEPQIPVLRRALDRLNRFVRPVAPLVEAVANLAQTVQITLGH
jgi:hypothetical protein